MKQYSSFNVEVETSTLLKSLHGAPHAGSMLMGCQELRGISNTLELLIKGHVLCREVACPLWQSGNSSCVLCREVVLFGRVGPQVVSFVERFVIL